MGGEVIFLCSMPYAKEAQVNRLSLFKVSALLLCLGLVSYANAIFHPFVHDDVVFIQNNPHLGSWRDLSSIFFRSSIGLTSGQPFSIINSYYRPLLEILYKIQYLVFHLNPHGYHLFNVLLHSVNSILVYVLIMFLPDGNSFVLKRKILAFCTAIFFLIHPVQTEAVACVSGVSNLVFAFFCLLSFICYLLAGNPGGSHRSVGWYGLALIFFGMALLAKEQAIMFPLLIILYEFCFHADLTRGKFIPRFLKFAISKSSSFIEKRGIIPRFPEVKYCKFLETGYTYNNFLRITGFLILAGGYFVLRKIITGASLAHIFDFKDELVLRVLQIPSVLLTFTGLMIFPAGLHYYRSVDVLQPFVLPMMIFSLFFGLLVFLVRQMPRIYWRWLAFSGGWFLLSLAPSLNIVPLINEYSFILTAEHFLYFSATGFVLFMVLVGSYGVARIFKEKEKIGVLLVAVLVLSGVVLTMKQNTYWRDEVPLFKRVVSFEHTFGRGHFLLAKAYYFHKEYPPAIIEYRIALDIMKNYLGKTKSFQAKKLYLGFLKEIYFDLAHCYEFQANLPGAIREYENALAIDPPDARLHNNLGVDYLYLNNFVQGIIHFQKAIALNPRDLQARNNLAICQIKQGNFNQAKETLEGVLKIDPNFQAAQQNLQRLEETFRPQTTDHRP